MSPIKSSTRARKGAKATVERQRAIQAEALAKAAKAPKAKKKAVQAGTRKQPKPPMTRQHLDKPGMESDLQLQPKFLAPDYIGSGKLQGLSALITGGDSGIGRAVAILFAREGADVAIVYLSEHEDAEVTAEHVQAQGQRCVLVPGDVRDPKFCEEAVAAMVKSFGRLDILVNNSAFQQHALRLEDISPGQLAETLETNIGGYFNMARAALPHMKQGGSIINSGSETGLLGSKHLLDYSATKGAIHAFTKSLASNLLPRGIRVNAVAPGPVWTPLNPADKTAKDVATFGQDSDMGRPAQPEEVSPAYVFLASPITASYINGIILPVMGGPGG